MQFNDQVSQYCTLHDIQYPAEIKEIKIRYGLYYFQITRVLGFGTNQYAKYENGEVPSESNGKMIAAIRDQNVLLGQLNDCKDSFVLTEYELIRTFIRKSEMT